MRMEWYVWSVMGSLKAGAVSLVSLATSTPTQEGRMSSVDSKYIYHYLFLESQNLMYVCALSKMPSNTYMLAALPSHL